jgi:hypothetical protein
MLEDAIQIRACQLIATPDAILEGTKAVIGVSSYACSEHDFRGVYGARGSTTMHSHERELFFFTAHFVNTTAPAARQAVLGIALGGSH